MDDLSHDELTIAVSYPEGESEIRLDWRGKSNDRRPREVLDPFFQELVGEAQEKGAAVDMHFENLEYFNSSTITALIQLIQDFRAKEQKLKISFDGSVKWQQLSFEALRIFEKSDGLIEIQEF